MTLGAQKGTEMALEWLCSLWFEGAQREDHRSWSWGAFCCSGSQHGDLLPCPGQQLAAVPWLARGNASLLSIGCSLLACKAWFAAYLRRNLRDRFDL